MSEIRFIEVQIDDAGQRMDNFLIRHLKGVPKSHIYRIIRSGEVRVNKKRVKALTRLVAGDMVRIPPLRMAGEKVIHVHSSLKEHLAECIIYEDERLLVLNKPSGLAVHGGSGLQLGAIEALRKIRDDLPYLELVHRLDRETSGCLLVAKKRSMLRSLHALLEARAVQKIYWALLDQSWHDQKKRVVNAPLLKNVLKSGERMVSVTAEGKSSETTFQLLENYKNYCLVEASPKTGRTHQIRVHSAHIGHPIVGDDKYGQCAVLPQDIVQNTRLYLHARSIQFNLAGKSYVFHADLDEKFAQTLDYFRTNYK